MISLLIRIKHHVPLLWRWAEGLNSFLGGIRYKNLKRESERVLEGFRMDGFSFSIVTVRDINPIIGMRNSQRPEYIENFNPHDFNEATLSSMLANNAYSLMKVTKEGSEHIVGYFFIRSFFVGRAFHGLLTDEKFSNMGVGTSMWKISMEICRNLGLRMFATMSESNRASFRSAQKATDVEVVQNLDNNYLLIECRKKHKTY